MEIVQENCAMLSNFEVLSLLKDNKKSSQSKGKRQQNTNVATILYSTLKYLENTPCDAQSPETVTAFMQAVQEFNLTKAEKLQLLNLRPATAVEIQLLIEESEERLSEEQIEQLLNTITEHLGCGEESGVQ